LKDLKLGIDYISRNWVADNYLMGGKYLNNMIPDVDINTIGTFIKHELKKDNFKIDSGLRLDFVSSKANEKVDAIELKRGVVDTSPNDTMVSGNAIFTYYLNDDTDVFIGVGHSQRTPDAQERFMNLKRPIMGKMEPNLNSFWIGNPDLKPTKNSELDIGISADLNSLTYSIKGFYSMLNDYITLDSFNNNGVDKTITYSNIDAIIYGATINLGYNIDNLFAKSSITTQRGKRDDDSSKDKDLAEIPPLKANLQIGYEDKKLLAMLEFQGATSQSRINEELGEKEIAGYIIENIKFSYNLNKNIKFDIAVDNLFDKDYAIHNSYIRDPFSSGIVVNEPQRTYYGAVKYSF